MRISEQFAGNYLKASDLPQPKVFTIAGCETATMPDATTKPALRFAGEPQQLILNKTNAYCLAEWFGDDTTGWNGKAVELYSTTTSFSGRMVPAIRVRQAPQWQQPVRQQAPVPQQFVPQQMQPVPQQFVPQQMQPVPERPSPENWPYFKQETSNVPQPPQAAPAVDYPLDA